MKGRTMESGRSSGARALAGVWIGCAVLALTAVGARAAEEAAADSGGVVPRGVSYSAEATSSYHYVNHPYFGADWGITSDPERQATTAGARASRACG